MTAASNLTRVVAVGESGSTQEQVIYALDSSNQSEFQLVDVIVPGENLVRDIRNANPRIIVIDYQTGEQSILDIIDELTLQVPGIAVVAIIPGNDQLVAQQVMLAGARAFIGHPFTQVNLLSTLRRVVDLESRQARNNVVTTQVESFRSLRTLAVFSPRGGVGCSTVAVNMAIALKEATDQRVLLVGGKLYFGHLGLMLNIRTNNSLADLIPHAGQIDEGLIRDVVFQHISGIHVLVEPFDFQVAQGIRPQDLYNVLTGITRMYDYIVIDAGSALNENTVTILDVADRILLLTTPELASMHDTKRFLEMSRSLDYQPGKMLVALNRVGMQGSVKNTDISGALHQEVFAEIPDGGSNVLFSINRGVPLITRYPRNSASKAIRNMAKRIGQQEVVDKRAESAIPSPM
jgi:pilus assembly protein CpaE